MKARTVDADLLLSLVEAEFRYAKRQVESATNDIERHSRASEALAYADVKLIIAELTQEHYSDCSLHNAPAHPISRCDCGGFYLPQKENINRTNHI